jgi:hypothetical protein
VQAQHDLDELLNAALGFAQQRLAMRGGFSPYAAAIGAEGEVEMIAVRPDPATERPHPADVSAACFAALTEKRRAIRAGAVATDVQMVGDDEAIRVDLEHAEGIALVVLLPYTKGRPGQDIDYGQIRAQAGQQQIWL